MPVIEIPVIPGVSLMSKEKHKTHCWKFLIKFMNSNYFFCERCSTDIRVSCADSNLIFGADLSCDEGVIKDILE